MQHHRSIGMVSLFPKPSAAASAGMEYLGTGKIDKQVVNQPHPSPMSRKREKEEKFQPLQPTVPWDRLSCLCLQGRCYLTPSPLSRTGPNGTVKRKKERAAD